MAGECGVALVGNCHDSLGAVRTAVEIGKESKDAVTRELVKNSKSFRNELAEFDAQLCYEGREQFRRACFEHQFRGPPYVHGHHKRLTFPASQKLVSEELRFEKPLLSLGAHSR